MMSTKLLFSRLALITLGSVGLTVALNACDGDGGSGGGKPGGNGDGGSTSTGNNTGGGAGTGGGPGTGGNGTGGNGTGGGSAVVCDEPGGTIPALKLTEIATGLDLPIFVTSEPADANRLYVVEQTGAIRIIENGDLLGEPFLDVSDVIQAPSWAGDERGLLGLAFHPDYAQNGRFYIYYNRDPDNTIAIAEYRRSSDPNAAEPGSADEIMVIEPTQEHPHYGNHNGGMIAFGPDGYLYAGVGDGGSSGDPNNNGQNLDVRLGKILRIDVENPQTAPQGNVSGGDPFIWDFGLRNPWRFSFDSCKGDLYIGDVGQGSREEVDVEPAGQGNKNYGWSVMEGTFCFKDNQTPACDDPSLVPPVTEYSHQSNDGCSINGGYVYRGGAIPALRGTYFYGDYCTNRIWTFNWKDGMLEAEGELTNDLESTGMLQAMSSFGEDAAGELYVVDLAGTIFRIDPE